LRWGTAEFFERHRDGSRRSAAIAVPLLVEQFEPRSVVDVGWGTGVWLSVFHEHGVTDILGIDGPWVKEPQREIPDSFFGECDLTQPLTLDRTFDPALCLELAEHLPAEAAPRLVESLTALAPVVVFSAAIPGQGEKAISTRDGQVSGRDTLPHMGLFASPAYGTAYGPPMRWNSGTGRTCCVLLRKPGPILSIERRVEMRAQR
jgi:hypothetical protein